MAQDLKRFGWKPEAIMTDNGGEFRSHAFRETVEELGAEHRPIRSGRPQTNGCVERLQGTILEECWKPAFARYLVPRSTGLRKELKHDLGYYYLRGCLHRTLDAGPDASHRNRSREDVARPMIKASPLLGNRTA